jgi:fibronectin type 3 domain-containing protein
MTVKAVLLLKFMFELGILSCGIGLVHAATFVPPANNRVDINFNADWLYVQGDVSGAQAQAFNDSSWTSVGLPHTTKFVSPEDPTAYIGVSWYRKHFTVSSSYQGRKVFIEFGAAMQTADVYINGTLAVHHDGGYTPFMADATSLVNYGGADNVIAARIDSAPNGNIPPGNSNPDFQYHGGLYRDVTIHVTDPLHVTDAVYANKAAGGGVFVTYPTVTSGSATVDVKTDVLNENGTAQSATVISTLADAGNNVVVAATNTVSIPAGTNHVFDETLVVASPNLWHPYNPCLYTLHTVVQKGATAVDYLKTRVGIRTIQWSHDNGFLINGVQFKARGANFHQDIYGEGNAMPDRTVYYDVKRLKEAGFDFVRCSHYPHNTAFYDACDQLGVLVMDSVPGWQYFSSSATFTNNTYKDCRDMIRRDRNHPSIVVWETSLNEAGFTTAWASDMQAIAHAEYPGDQMYTTGWTTTIFDVFCSSSQAGVRSSTDTRPIIVDEYGDWDYGGNSSTSRVAREGADTNLLVQCGNWQESLDADLGLSWFSADAVWDFTDYTGYLSMTTKCGAMDHYRLPKFSYYFYQSQRDPTVSIPNVQSGPMVYIANTHQTNSPTAIRVFSNCQQVSLYTNGVLFATQSPDTTYPNLPHPPFTFNLTRYVNGPIRTDGITNGTVACSFSRLVPASPSQIVLNAEGMDSLSADGGDARLVFVSVVDANGQVVPSSTDTVNLSVSGHGKIIGPTAIQMKGGQLATWIQAGRAVGTVTLTASGTTLSPASLTLTNQAVPNIDPLPAPAVPTGLTVTSGQTSLTLNWNPAAHAFTYNVKSGTVSGGPYNVIASNVPATSYTLALDGTNYYFVVSAVNEEGVESANSAEGIVVVPSSLISLVNSGFETNTAGAVINVKVNKGFDVSTNNVMGWTNAGSTYRDSGVDYMNDNGVVPNSGIMAAYCQGADGGAYQIVRYQMQTGDQITLTWWAKTSYSASNTTQNVRLLSAASTNSAYSSLIQLTNSTAALNNTGNGGAYTQYTLNYTATAGDAGKYVAASFTCSSPRNNWAMFDDFNLTVLSIPAAPGGLTATPVNGQVGLSWSAVSSASGYYIKRSLVSGESYNNIATNSASLTFTNTGLANGTTYYYVVSAFNQAGAGTNSTEVSAVPLPPIPAIPTGLTAQASSGQIVLTWNSSAYATGYNVFRSLIPGGFDTWLANNITSTNYADATVTPGTAYYYSVTATNMSGQSDFSSQASATVPAKPPTFGTISLSGTNLIVNGTNGTAGMNCLVLMSSNLASPLANWTVLATNIFGPGGGFNFTNPLNPASPQQFYRLKLP